MTAYGLEMAQNYKNRLPKMLMSSQVYQYKHACVFVRDCVCMHVRGAEPTDLAVGQLVGERAQEHGLVGGLVESRPAGDVGARVGQTQPAALQGGVDGVGEGGLVGLWVVAEHLIHPTLEAQERHTMTLDEPHAHSHKRSPELKSSAPDKSLERSQVAGD